MNFFIISLILFALNNSQNIVQPAETVPVTFLLPGEKSQVSAPGLKIFCHNARSKYLTHFWTVLLANIEKKPNSYKLYHGDTPEEVQENHRNQPWSFNFFGISKSNQIKIDPFKNHCIGIDAQYINRFEDYHYQVSISELRIDHWKLIATIFGILLFWNGKSLSRNVVFHYICGIIFGVTTSLLFLLHFFRKILPQGKVVYATLFAGYAMSFYVAQMIFDNLQVILMQYKEWVVYYIMGMSLVSFIICYRLGPVKNPRTMTIIQWFLQAVGFFCIYQSSYFVEASIGICISLFIIYLCPISFFNGGRRYWKKMFPYRRRFLSDDQYREEGIKETQEALIQLREFCSSPESRPWKTVLQLNDPIRFAQFIQGDCHVSQNELHEYDLELSKLTDESQITDDEVEEQQLVA